MVGGSDCPGVSYTERNCSGTIVWVVKVPASELPWGKLHEGQLSRESCPGGIATEPNFFCIDEEVFEMKLPNILLNL